MPATVEDLVDVSYSQCDTTFPVTARSARRYRQGRSRPFCPSCKPGRRPSGRQAKPPEAVAVELTDSERPELRDWWLERFSPYELLELGRMLWPESRRRPYTRRLATSDTDAHGGVQSCRA
jgi:hypothetical protein